MIMIPTEVVWCGIWLGLFGFCLAVHYERRAFFALPTSRIVTISLIMPLVSAACFYFFFGLWSLLAGIVNLGFFVPWEERSSLFLGLVYGLQAIGLGLLSLSAIVSAVRRVESC